MRLNLCFVALILILNQLNLSCNTTENSDKKNNSEKEKHNDSDNILNESLENTGDFENSSDNGETTDIDDKFDKDTISKIQKGEVPAGSEVLIDSVVTAIVYAKDEDFNLVGIKGIFVSELIEKALPYSGIYVFIKDTAALDDYNIGDRISVLGKYREFYDNSQIEAKKEDIYKTGEAIVPEPVEITDPSAVSTPFVKKVNEWVPLSEHGEDSEKYESVLIKISDVETTNVNLGNGNWEVTGNLAVDKTIYYYPEKTKIGEKFSEIKGVLIYSYNAFRLAPRNVEDIIKDIGNTGDSGNTGNSGNSGNSGNTGDTSDTVITSIQKGEIDENSEVSFECVIVAIVYNLDKNYEKTSIKGLYVSDLIDQAVPYSGIHVFIVGNPGIESFQIGDKISVTGTYKEYYDSSQVEANKTNVIKTGTYRVPLPIEIEDPSTVATAFIKNGSVWIPGTEHGKNTELYESVFVQVKNPEIINSSIGNGNFVITGSLAVDKTMYYYTGSRNEGKKFNYIQGILLYSYNAFRLAPRNAEDINE